MASEGPLVYIVIYSLFHHVYEVSLAVKKGLEAKGAQVKLFQVQETLSDDILTKMKAPEKPDIPVITVDMLTEPDALIFGLPTRFGIFPSQVKALLDASGSLWAKGALAGKFAGTFFSTASQHGGQETTALTAITYFAHHGMMYIPFGFANTNLFDNSEVIGGSAYGAGTVAGGDGARQPTEAELDIATNQGENFANILNTFMNGKQKMLLKQQESPIDTTNKEVITDAPSAVAPTADLSSTTGTAVAATAATVGAGSAAAAAAAITSNNSTSVPDPASATTAKLPVSEAEESNVSPLDGTKDTKDTNIANEVIADPIVAAGTTTAAPATVSEAVSDPIPDSSAAPKAEPTKPVVEETKPVAAAAAATTTTTAKPTTTEPKKKKKPWFCCG